MKDWIAVHTWNEDDDRERFTKKYGESFFANEKVFSDACETMVGAKCRQTWLGEDAFFFCHWQAPTDQAVIDVLEGLGMNEYFQTACYEMTTFMSQYRVHGSSVYVET